MVLKLKKPKGDNLNRLLQISNRLLGAYNQPPLYATKVRPENKALKHDRGKSRLTEAEDLTNGFHISLAWSLTEPSVDEQQRVEGISLDKITSLDISFTSVKAKIGNVVHSLDLESM